jgi:hypothetical protein
VVVRPAHWERQVWQLRQFVDPLLPPPRTVPVGHLGRELHVCYPGSGSRRAALQTKMTPSTLTLFIFVLLGKTQVAEIASARLR